MKNLILLVLLIPALASLGQDAMFYAMTGFVPSGPVEPDNWNISNASYQSSLYINAREDVIQGVFMGNYGTRMYICGHTNDRIDQYDLSTAHDLSTATYSKTLSVSGYTGYPQDLCFDRTGTRFYFVDASSARVVQFNLSQAWELNTASYVGALTISAYIPSPDGICISDDGTKMLGISDSSDKISTINLSTPYLITSGTDASKDLSILAKDGTSCAVCASNDGTVVWFVGRTSDYVHEYTLSTAWDVTTATWVRQFYVGSYDGSPMGLSLDRQGLYMYIAGNVNDMIYQFHIGPNE